MTVEWMHRSASPPLQAGHPVPSPVTPWAGESPGWWGCSSPLCCPGVPGAAGLSRPGFGKDGTICCRAPRCQVRVWPGAKDTGRESAAFGELYAKCHLSGSRLCSSPSEVSSAAPRAPLGRTPASSQQQETLHIQLSPVEAHSHLDFTRDELKTPPWCIQQRRREANGLKSAQTLNTGSYGEAAGMGTLDTAAAQAAPACRRRVSLRSAWQPRSIPLPVRGLVPQRWVPSGPQLAASPAPPAQRLPGEEKKKKRKQVGENDTQ